MANRKHGLHHTPEYKAWQQMKDRCENPKARAYDNYGGRGIKVCEAWSGPDGFLRFFADMGQRPSPEHSLDRINNDGNYTHLNCRWATYSQQMRNRRVSKLEDHEYEQVRWLVAEGNQQKSVAAFFGISRPFACAIVNGQRGRRSAA